MLDLADHADVAEVDLADVDRAELVAPLVGLRRNLVADVVAHRVAVHHHRGERHVAEAADGGVADVGGKRAARVAVLEEVGNGIADEHFMPEADAHRGAFLGVHRLAAQVFLVEPHVEDVALAEPVHDEGGGAELEGQDVQAGLVDGGEHLSEEDVDVALALMDDRIQAEAAGDAEEDGKGDEAADKRADGGDEEVGHFFDSTKTC